MAEVITVKFKDGGRAYYFDPAGIRYAAAEKVIVETANGNSFGIVSETNHEVSEKGIVSPLKRVLRVATDKDIRRVEENKHREEEAFRVCDKKIAEHKLDMKLVEVEYAFDGTKITFFFTADGRIDFRELVKDLASYFHTRIELRQIGVRDEARMLGGIGICGQPFCCKRFLDDFQPVSIKMAKEQGLSLNPTKISGSCGRLMCCLKYEQNAYDYLASVTPGVGSTVRTEDGTGTVVDVNLISGNLLVKMRDSEAIPVKVNRKDVKTISGGRRMPAEKTERADKPERNEKGEKPLRTDRTGRPGKGMKAPKTEKPKK